MSRGAAASSGAAVAKILVMDDDNAIRLLVSQILMMAGYGMRFNAQRIAWGQWHYISSQKLWVGLLRP